MMPAATRFLTFAGSSLLILFAFNATAQADESPELSLAATVSSSLEQDELQVVFSAQSEASSAKAANEQLIKALNDARAKLGEPSDVNISNGVVQTYPVYGKQKEPTIWRGRGELILDSSDLSAVSAAADKLTGLLALSRVNFSLSDQARRAEQSRLIEQAAQAFRQKAQTSAEAFGYESYEILTLDITNSGEVMSPRPMLATRMASADAAPSPSLDLQPNRESVTVTVSGSVSLR